MSPMLNFCRPEGQDRETRFLIKTSGKLTKEQLFRMRWFLQDDDLSETPYLYDTNGKKVVEVGPPPDYATANSTNLTQIFHNMGIPQVIRIEEFKRIRMLEEEVKQFVQDKVKKWTERWYKVPLKRFSVRRKPGLAYVLPLSKEGIRPLSVFNKEHDLGFDDWMLNWCYQMYIEDGWDPTDAAIYNIGQLLSSHCRHWEFMGRYFIDGTRMPYTPFELIKAPHEEYPGNSLVAFYDNSSAIRGYEINYLLPERPGECSPMVVRRKILHPTNTAETHSAPTGEEAYEGAGTGVIGMRRDLEMIGRGGFSFYNAGGYCWPHLFFPGHDLIWEDRPKEFRNGHPKDMIIQSFLGLILSANENGFPCLLGFTRSMEMEMPDGRYEAFFKPILYALGSGGVFDENVRRIEPEIGDKQIRIGGPVYPTGVGGGSFSSQTAGSLKKDNSSKAVQRVDPEMAQKMYQVVKTCAEMGEKNPSKGGHDQGAGGTGCCTTESANPLGVEGDIEQISRGVENLPDMIAFNAEFQESNWMTVAPDSVDEVKRICAVERCPCDVYGTYTGTGRMVVRNSRTGQTIVDHNLEKVLGELPRREYHFTTRLEKLLPFDPPNMSIAEATKLIFSNVAVGSKGFLTNLMDRSVKGRTVYQQCCGPMQIPIGDAAVFALSFDGPEGMVSALGEQPLKLMIDPEAGIRMAKAEVLTNMAGVWLRDWADAKCSVNWMWAIKFLGEGAALYRAVNALSHFDRELGKYCGNRGMAQPDGGKDSLFMQKLIEEIIKSFRQCVIGGYCTVPDIRKIATPDIKRPGRSKLMYINPSPGKYRLGGSIFAYCNKQLGNESPDIDDPWLFYQSLAAVQQLVKEGLILSLHDRSDGGLITTATEMIMAHNCGFNIDLPHIDGNCEDPIAMLMAEEAGWICEYDPRTENAVKEWFEYNKVPHHLLGWTTEKKVACIRHQGKVVFEERTPTLRGWWEATSHQFERQFRNPVCADQRYERTLDRNIPEYRLTYTPKTTALEIMIKSKKVKAAVLREEGSNGDQEMAEMAYLGGMEPTNVHTSLLVEGSVTLDPYKVLLPVGGFANRDAGKHGKGWAGTLKYNPNAAGSIGRFYERKDTCTYGPCNAMQAFLYLGIAPFPNEPEENWPRMDKNDSWYFEHNWINVLILKSKSVAFQGMAGSFVGIHTAHGAGKVYFRDASLYKRALDLGLVPMAYADDLGNVTELYPWNPNGSPFGIAGFCSPDGRHTFTMPHIERFYRIETAPWLPEKMKRNLETSYFLQVMHNLREFSEQHQEK
jgi:phosphoribosylformylglycinamidine synthase